MRFGTMRLGSFLLFIISATLTSGCENNGRFLPWWSATNTPMVCPTQTPFSTYTPYPTSTPPPTPTPYFTPTSYPTLTPYPTYTLYPTQTPFSTYTPYPTHTPHPTLTPYFTSTPYPTYTPYPTPTPLPTPALPSDMCNPPWGPSTTLDLQVADSPEEARQILVNELRRATRVAVVPDSRGNVVYIYLTYMSPQVIEAIVVDKAVREKWNQAEARRLLIEFERRLQVKNALPFLVTIRGDSRDVVNLGPLDEHMVLVNQRHEKIPPLLEYTSALAEPIDMSRGGIEGYVLFPRNLGEKSCKPSVDLLNDHSFDVRIKSVSGKNCEGLFFEVCQPYEDVNLLWPYTLLPDVPLEEAVNIPLPQRATENIDMSTLSDILGLALNIFELFTP